MCLKERLPLLRIAARDLRFLLDRAYARREAISLVANRYQLITAERDILHRGVFARKERHRKKKRVSLGLLCGSLLAIDGHNVLITIESALRGLPLVLGDDGFMRDTARAARGYAPSAFTTRALVLVCHTLAAHSPRDILFLLDSPVSQSGELAATARAFLSEYDLTAAVQAVPVPERHLCGYQGIVATSDSAIIDRSDKVFDLAGHIIRYRLPSCRLIRLR